MGKKILIVDDSATARMLFKVLFADQDGYEISEADYWEKALSMSKEEQFDLIVFDYNMPDKVGTELAQLMIEAGVDAKFVLMSANTQPHVLEDAKKLGFIAILEKPADKPSIQQILEQL